MSPVLQNTTVSHIFIKYVKVNDNTNIKKKALKFIPEKQLTGYEHYLTGLDLYNKNKKRQALKEWEKALSLGYTKAIPEMTDILLKNIKQQYEKHLRNSTTQNYQDYIRELNSLRPLADSLYPEAAYAYGEQMLKTEEKERGLRYLGKAACQYHKPAMKQYANVVWQNIQQFNPFEDNQKKYNTIRIKYALEIYSYLFKNSNDPKYSNRIGIILYGMGRRSEALAFLKLAADAGQQMSAYLMGYIYLNKIGVALDYKKARDYFIKAGDFADAKEQVQKIKQLINNEEQNKTDAFSFDTDYAAKITRSKSTFWSRLFD